MQLRIGCSDVVSNSHFPALAAEELGLFRAEGLDAHVELIQGANAFKALRNEDVHALALSAHGVLGAFPQWQGAKLIAALAQGVPWLLVMRSNLSAKRGDLSVLQGMRIGAAPNPGIVLRRILIECGIETEKQVHIVPLSGAENPNMNYGIFAAEALQENRIDGFWANAMGAEVSIQRGVGKIFLDVRRDHKFVTLRNLTFATIATTDPLLGRYTDELAAIVRAIVKAQQVLRADPGAATEVGNRRFPKEAAALIAGLVERDLPFYDAAISTEAVDGLNRLGQALGLSSASVPYEHVVAPGFHHWWTA